MGLQWWHFLTGAAALFGGATFLSAPSANGNLRVSCRNWKMWKDLWPFGRFLDGSWTVEDDHLVFLMLRW